MRFHQTACFVLFWLIVMTTFGFAASRANEECSDSVKAVFIERVLGWMADPTGGNGQFPRIDHFGQDPGQIRLDDILEQWSTCHTPPTTAFFDTPEQMYLEIKPLAEQRGLRPRLLFLPLQIVDPRLLPELRQEAHELVLYWMMKHSWRIPSLLDFGSLADRIPVDYARLVGRGPYGEKEMYAHLALFDSEEHFWTEFQRFAAFRGVQVNLLDISFARPISPRSKRRIQEEAIDRIVQWMFDPSRGARRKPQPSDFKDQGGTLTIPYQRLTARGKYARGARAHHQSIFLSNHIYEFALDERLTRIQHNLKECDLLF